MMSESLSTETSPFCRGCGYPRIGLPRSLPCPECGRNARTARRRVCAALVPLAGDVRDGLLYGLATAGLGLLHLLRAWRYAAGNQTVRRLCRMTIRRQRWGFLAGPRTLLIGWVGCLLLAVLVTAMRGGASESIALVIEPVLVERGSDSAEMIQLLLKQIDPLLKVLVVLLLGWPVLHSVIAMATWHNVAIAAAHRPAGRARWSAALVAGSLAALLGALLCYSVWPEPMSQLDDRWLLVAFLPLLLATGVWLGQWHRLLAELQDEARTRPAGT